MGAFYPPVVPMQAIVAEITWLRYQVQIAAKPILPPCSNRNNRPKTRKLGTELQTSDAEAKGG
jgi:hypothetical protein